MSNLTELGERQKDRKKNSKKTKKKICDLGEVIS
jgi:hypothetical protein